VAGHPVVSCALTAGIVDSGCPVKPECWGGTFSSSGVLISAEVISCSRPHTWETFAVGAIPSDVVDTGVPHERQTAASPLAQRLCSTAVLGKALTGAASRIPPSAWVVDVMGPTQAKFDAGDHAFRCLARVDGMESSTGTAFSASATPYTTQPPT
jgi:hypothetical protein